MFNYCLGRKGGADGYAEEETAVKTLDEEPVKEEPEVVAKDEEGGEPDAEFMAVIGSGSAEKEEA